MLERISQYAAMATALYVGSGISSLIMGPVDARTFFIMAILCCLTAVGAHYLNESLS